MDVDEVRTLKLIVKSPAGLLFEANGLKSVQLALIDGGIGIRAGHAPMIAEVSDGEVVLDDGESIVEIPVHAGITVVQDDLVTIYTHSIDPNLSTIEIGNEDSEEEFEALYDAIIATLMPGSDKAEGQNGN
jgi:F0F1-type ATP synthase epsilon subunit